MKKSALTIAISSLLLASGAHAATVYNQNDTKLEIGGRAQGMYYGTDDNGSEGDQSYFRVNMRGETKIAPEMKAFGFAEYNLPTSGSDNDELRYAYAGIKHDRFGAFSYGRQDGLFRIVNDYTDVLPEWGGDGLGKGTEVFGTGRTNGLAQYIYTFDGLVLGAQFTGENEAQNESDSSWTRGSEEGYALSANYNFDMGISLGLAYNQAGKTADQAANTNFGGSEDAKLTAVGIKYNANNLYAAATYAYGENHVYVNQAGNDGYASESNGYEAVVQYTWGQWKPSLAYNRLDVKDSDQNLDDTLTEYVSIGAWYNINENFDIYVDYKANLLSSEGSDGYNKFGQNTDDVVGVAMQYHF